jgi:peptidoglycan hydrolase-like protein with peptidoglycan-binding domain
MLLKVGSKGDDVKKLQEKLGLTADGSFGPNTEKKVKEWQTANGLTADGLVGDGTWSKMF